MKQNVVWGVVAVVVLLAGVMLPFGGSSVVERVVVGGVSSDSSHKYFGDQVTVGGRTLATTTGVTLTAYTLTAQELSNQTLALNISREFTLSLGATSTKDLVPSVGDTAIVYLKNASTTAASTLTLAEKDASTDIQYAETTGGDVVIEGGNWAKLTFIRNSVGMVNAAVTVIVDEFKPL